MSRAALLRCALPAVTLLAAPSCLRLGYVTASVEQPITAAQEQKLRESGATLGRCLEVLGAPLYVWRAARSRTALAWGWREAEGWGFFASYSWSEYGPNASFSYDEAAEELEGFVAWFDEHQRLVATQRGRLRELVGAPRR